MIGMSNRVEKAKQFFLNGCNCSQAVAMAFNDLTELDDAMMMKLSSSFGGGLGRMREVCGAVSGIAIILGILYGYDNGNDMNAKKEHYARIQSLADRFKKKFGSIVCRDILKNSGTSISSSAQPTSRTESFYKERPCLHCVETAARILEEYIQSKER